MADFGFTNLFSDAGQRYGVDPKTLNTFARIESGGRPTARTGSYSGLFQLSPGEFNKFGGGNIFDPADNTNAAAAKLAAESAAFKAKYSRDPSPADLYMIHQQGEGGYAAHTANPDAPAWQNMASTAEGRQKGPEWAKKAIWGNVPDDVKAQYPGGVDSLTSKQFMDLWANKVARLGGDGSQTMTPYNAANYAAPADIDPNDPLSSMYQPTLLGLRQGNVPVPGVPGGAGPTPINLPTPPNARYSKLADALMGSAAGAKPTGWGSLLNALGDAGLGYSLANKADTQEKDYKSSLAKALGGASDNDTLVRTMIASGDPQMMQAGVQAKIAMAKKENAIGRYHATKQGVLDSVTGQIIPGTENVGGDKAEYGTSPQYYTDKDGNLHITQLSKAGGRKDVELPEGATIQPGVQFQNLGTSVQPLNKKTGEAAGPALPIDVSGKASQAESGQLQAKAKDALPTVETTTNRVLGILDTLDKSPTRSSFTGYSGYLPVVTPEARDYEGYLNQMKGNFFLQAFQSLRGGGAITEIEGAKATDALSRLQTIAPSEKGYQKALDDAREVMREILTNARKRAQVGGPSPQPAAPVQTGGAPAVGGRLKFNPATGELE